MAKQKKITKRRITSKDIAAYFQVSKSTVLQWIKERGLIAFPLPSGHNRFEKQDVIDFAVKWGMPIPAAFKQQ
jgi:excisionase family DNA binding protein